jgi:hypothetical protein
MEHRKRPSQGLYLVSSASVRYCRLVPWKLAFVIIVTGARNNDHLNPLPPHQLHIDYYRERDHQHQLLANAIIFILCRPQLILFSTLRPIEIHQPLPGLTNSPIVSSRQRS